MQNWKYRVVMVNFTSPDANNIQDDLEDIAAALNIFGNQGWEVAGIYPIQNSSSAKVVLKKPVE